MEENGKTAAPVLQLEEHDRLSVENVYLKLQNLSLQVEKLDRIKAEAEGQKVEAVAQMRDLQEQMKKKRDELSVKYGTSIEAATVTPDGRIIPKVAKVITPPPAS